MKQATIEKMTKPVQQSFSTFAEGRAPFRSLSPDLFALLTNNSTAHTAPADTVLLNIGDPVPGLYIITSGAIDLLSPQGDVLTQMHAGDVFGHRAMLRDTGAVLAVRVKEPSTFVIVEAAIFAELVRRDDVFASFFSRRVSAPDANASLTGSNASDLVGLSIGEIMTQSPVTVAQTATVNQAAKLMWEKNISCVLVIDDGQKLAGIVTAGDLVGNIIAAGRPASTTVDQIMTANPTALTPADPMLSAVLALTEKRIGHLPVVNTDGTIAGIVTQTDLVRRNSNSMIFMINDIARQTSFEGLAAIVARKPMMLAELSGSGIEGHKIGRLMTGISDAVTKRLLALAQQQLGPAPVPWLWLACGSQGREEQTGVSDQDNCLFLSDDYDEASHGAYFEAMAKYVCDGLDVCGYFYCPGDMMASNKQWRQPVRVWKSYFSKWISKPDPMAQMLASVMFDLRPVAGTNALFGSLHRETLEQASTDSIFRAHMVSNSLKHTPPLGLFGGLTYVRGAAQKNAIDMKHSGVVPITDLARAYALQGRIEAANTRERLVAARDMDGVLSKTGGSDLIDAYDLIVELRIAHQARQIRAGVKPDNLLVPDTLSALERNHLKDAFSVVKTLQSAAGYGRS